MCTHTALKRNVGFCDLGFLPNSVYLCVEVGVFVNGNKGISELILGSKVVLHKN